MDTAEKIEGANDPRPFDGIEDAVRHPGYTGYDGARYGPGRRPFHELNDLFIAATNVTLLDSRINYWRGIIWNEYGDAALVEEWGEDEHGCGKLDPITNERARELMVAAMP